MNNTPQPIDLLIQAIENQTKFGIQLIDILSELAAEMTAAIDEYMRWLGHRYQVALVVALVLLTLIIGMAQ
jgi:hypothetical protein